MILQYNFYENQVEKVIVVVDPIIIPAVGETIIFPHRPVFTIKYRINTLNEAGEPQKIQLCLEEYK